MKLTIANAALLMSMAGFASAATVNVNGYININFAVGDVNGPNLVDSSYTAYVGVYTGGVLSTTTASFADINSAWTSVGSYQFATAAAGNYNGSFAGSAIAFDTSVVLVGGQNVWLWVTDGGLNNFLMQAVNSSAGDFLFKTDGVDFPNSGNLAVSTAAIPGWNVVLGSFTTGGANSGYGGSYVLNTAIPEPATALLGAFGAIGLLRRRRA